MVCYKNTDESKVTNDLTQLPNDPTPLSNDVLHYQMKNAIFLNVDDLIPNDSINSLPNALPN